jgi:hypothetical protein
LQMSGCQCGGQAHGACVTEFQYAVKLVCGEVVAATPGAAPTVVAPGRYWTAINIHNPDKCKDANFRWKVAVAYPGEQGQITPFRRTRPLGPDGAIEIDCPQVMQILQPQAPAFVKGYVVIESDIELDVVAVYTGSAGPCGGNTFHTERVPPRCVPACEDLVLPLHTGFADWRTVNPATLAPVLVQGGAWVAPPFGSKWVSQFNPDSVLSPRTYGLDFDLCSGFENPSPPCEIQLIVNDTATVFLNGVQLGAVVPFNTLTVRTLPPLRIGRNSLQVQVFNSSGQTGFALGGVLYVPRGKCPCAHLPIAPSK